MNWQMFAMFIAGISGSLIAFIVIHSSRNHVAKKSSQASIAKEFDRHAPKWRTCECDSCKERRKHHGGKF